jgi:hypothetical protein
VSGHHQTHLGWAKGQSGQEKKKKPAVLLYCRFAKTTPCKYNVGTSGCRVFFFSYLAELAIIYNTV